MMPLMLESGLFPFRHGKPDWSGANRGRVFDDRPWESRDYCISARLQFLLRSWSGCFDFAISGFDRRSSQRHDCQRHNLQSIGHSHREHERHNGWLCQLRHLSKFEQL
jgi:hypothetical protein